jgi:geranylgeranyl diphosphate synthase, type II
MLGGATDGCSGILYEFGKSLGIAFQLMDDYLDVYGDSYKTGKQMSGDILSNKKTFLSTKAFELSDEKEKIEFQSFSFKKNEDKIVDTLNFFERKNIQAITLNEINLYSAKAFTLLEKAPILSKRKIYIQELAETLLKREF